MRKQFTPVRRASRWLIFWSSILCAATLLYTATRNPWSTADFMAWTIASLLLAGVAASTNLYIHWKTFRVFEWAEAKPDGSDKLMILGLTGFGLNGVLVCCYLFGFGMMATLPVQLSLRQILIWHYSVQILPWVAGVNSIILFAICRGVENNLREAATSGPRRL